MSSKQFHSPPPELILSAAVTKEPREPAALGRRRVDKSGAPKGQDQTANSHFLEAVAADNAVVD